MVYPFQLVKVPLHNCTFDLYIPDAEKLPALYQLQLEQDAAAPFPYWASLWPSGIALASYLQQHPHWVKDKNVAELAAGVGLPSVVAAGYAKQVWCSDWAAPAVEVAKLNVQLHHRTNMLTEVCDWNKLPADFNPEVVLLSDVNYEPAVFEDLLSVLLDLLHKGITLMLSTPQRLMARSFIERLLPFVIEQVEEMVEEAGKQVFINVYVLKTLEKNR